MTSIRLQFALLALLHLSPQFYCAAFVFSQLPTWCRRQQVVSLAATLPSDEASKEAAIVNLVADDEWKGLSMELSELVRVAVVEDLKKNVRDFTGKEDYHLGDVSKEVDARVKGEVARLRNKDEYELFDLARAADELSKNYAEQLTGKSYQAGDISSEVDKGVKVKVAEISGNDNHSFEDFTREVDKGVQEKADDFSSKAHEIGDIAREVGNRRRKWVRDFLGEVAAKNYEISENTKRTVAQFTGKDGYQFGDITKKVMANTKKAANNLFGSQANGKY
jgi:hypothetical protein